MIKTIRTTTLIALLALGSAPAMAVPVYGGSDLLGAGDAALLQHWLGNGNIALHNIFDKETGDSSADFHAAADHRGETFTLIEVLGNVNGVFDEAIVIGGYNPLSWDASRGSYHYSGSGPRDAFIFNLNDDVVLRQGAGWRGTYQTYNRQSYGPTFGGGHDIWINSSLSGGYTNGYSYGDTSQPYSVYSPTANILGEWGAGLTIGQLEVFAVHTILDFDNAGEVPEPGTGLLIGLGLTAMTLGRRRRQG